MHMGEGMGTAPLLFDGDKSLVSFVLNALPGACNLFEIYSRRICRASIGGYN